MCLKVERIYESNCDDYRILVDRLWPRGISKEKAKLDMWAKDIAPSNELRKWYGHDKEKYIEFKNRYINELNNNPETIKFIKKIEEIIKEKNIVLLFSAKDKEYSNAKVLFEYLSLNLEKDKLRKKYVDIRKNVENREEKNNKIYEKIIENEYIKKANVIALYKNTKYEVDTKKIANFLISLGKKVLYPRVNGNKLDFYFCNNLENVDFEKSSFGIYEPKENLKKIENLNYIDVIIVPLLCVDKNNNRLGYGKAYYDKTLSKTNAYKIGICYEEQVLKDKELPVREGDIKLNEVIYA